jgi:hypothetical protein
MNSVTEQWNQAKAGGFGTPTTWRLSQQIQATKTEHEAFHAMMKLIPSSLTDEAIRLWVKGTESASAEAYNRRLLMSELEEADYREAQDIAHKEWKELLKISA